MNSTPIEIERKYIIEIPDKERMRLCEGYSESEILQIYIESAPHVTHRVRRRKRNGNAVYTETKKIRIDKRSSYEDEREISERDFLSLSDNIKAGTVPIEKVRHAFDYLGQTFEIDVYPQWKSSCIMETELETRDKCVEFPEFIKIIKEVTGDNAYSNASMAQNFPVEFNKK